jgi:hypothetical protein
MAVQSMCQNMPAGQSCEEACAQQAAEYQSW